MNSGILLLAFVAFFYANARPTKDADKDEKPVPRYMIRLYEQVANGLKAGGCGYNTIKNIRNLGEARSCQEYNLRFNASLIPPSDENEFLLAARIHLELNADSAIPAYRNARFRLYSKGATKNSKGRLLNDVTLPTSTTEDVIFDVTAITLKAQNAAPEFLDFILAVDGEPSLPACPPGDATFEAMLELQSSNSQINCDDVSDENKRLKRATHHEAISKRAIKPSSPPSSSTLCQRLPLPISFQEIGWDNWVIAPSTYDAYYCAGGCPFPIIDHLNASNHAVVQNFLHSMEPTNVPSPCCAPTRLSPISMLYIDMSGSLVIKVFQDMIVNACGCQ